ncbi:hypothetical protein ACHAXH_003381 [Discostella pseudostelligera]
MDHTYQARGDAAIVVQGQRKRHSNNLSCYAILALISAWSSPSTRICLVSGEIVQPSHRQHHFLSSLPHRVDQIHKVRRNNRRRWGVHGYRIPSELSLTSDVVFDLRCGGASHDEQSNADGDEAMVVDLSVVGSGDSPVTEEDDVTLSNSELESDMGCLQVEDENDGTNKESDSTVSVNDDGIMEDSDASEDIPLDVKSEDSANIKDISESVDGADSSSFPSEPPTSSQVTAHNADAHHTQKQTHLALLSSASDQRAEGKTLHDSGDLADAALAFQKAASLLDEAITISIEFSEEDASDVDSDAIAVERATCRLHEALCLFKDGRPGECIEACTDVLQDGVRVVPLEGETNKNNEAEIDDPDASITATVGSVKIITTPVRKTSVHTRTMTIPPQIRARALHRRAKARLALDDLDGALEDARSAAFMGDRNAVQFYGRLMREGSGAGAMTSGGLGAAFPSRESSTTNPFLEGILGGVGSSGSNPFMPAGNGSSDFSSSLLSSLLSGGNNGSSGGGSSPLLGLMGDLLAPQQPSSGGKKSGRGGRGKSKKGNGVDSLAKSILSSLMKRIEDEDTQRTICEYLHSTNTQQVMQYATLAGIPMKEGNARRLVTFANGVTPKGIRKSISNVKRGISIIKAVRKVFKVIEKYKYVIILAVTCYWIRCAILEPYPVRRSKKQAQKLAQQAVLSFILPLRDERGSLIAVSTGIADALSKLHSIVEDNFDEDDRGGHSSTMGHLQNQLALIEAIEQRNEAQLDSFVDEEDQWQSLEEDEKSLLRSKDSLIQRIDQLANEIAKM